MKVGQIIGRVVCTKKLDYFEGLKLLLVQPLDEYRQTQGDPFVAFDTVQAGPGDMVMYETSKEAGWTLREWYTPADAAIIGIIDRMDTEGAPA